jgi:nitroimidazol reductase NimA-like FMN-containing flavoprotein (pyridoxamine 5'-phosphate oxidase superfamily)
MRRKEREIADIKELESVIKNCDVCRVAFAAGNMPYIVTMNFGYHGGTEKRIYFHCAKEGRKLDMIRKNNYVCFEMDTDHELYSGEKGCDWGMKYSSIIGYGRISILENADARIEGLNTIMAHYSDKREFIYDERILEKTTILKLDIQEIKGKKK